MAKYILLQTHHEVIKESNSQDVKSAMSATKRKFPVYNTLEWLKEECIQIMSDISTSFIGLLIIFSWTALNLLIALVFHAMSVSKDHWQCLSLDVCSRDGCGLGAKIALVQCQSHATRNICPLIVQYPLAEAVSRRVGAWLGPQRLTQSFLTVQAIAIFVCSVESIGKLKPH